MKKLLVCTANYARDDTQLARLRESCDFYNLDFDYFGKGLPWEGSRISKAERMISYLKDIEHEYVLFTDGWDSWMLADEDSIMRKFKKFDKPVVACGHPFCYPYKEIGDQFPDAPTRFKYICAGQFMGERKTLIDVLYKVVQQGGWSDQGAWNRAFANGSIREEVAIDYGCDLFLTASDFGIEDLFFRSGKIFYMETGKAPIGIHFGGPKGGSSIEVNMNKTYDVWLKKR